MSNKDASPARNRIARALASLDRRYPGPRKERHYPNKRVQTKVRPKGNPLKGKFGFEANIKW